jgi:hypothetical protein
MIERFRIKSLVGDDDAWEAFSDDDGDLVLYSDYTAALRARDEEIGRLRHSASYWQSEAERYAATIGARDERIAELERVVKAFLKEHDDTYDGGPISSGQVAAVELARSALAEYRKEKP